MSALVKSIDLGKCPKLDRWIGDKEGLLAAYVNDMQRVIPQLLAAQAGMEAATPDFEAVGHAARVLGCLAADMDTIQRELYG